MLEIPRVVALGRLGESVVSSDEDAHAPLAKFLIHSGCRVDHALHLPPDFGIAVEAELLTLIERAVDNPDRRPHENSILHGLQHVDRFLVRRFTVIDNVTSATNGS